jgi:hypothetical protein
MSRFATTMGFFRRSTKEATQAEPPPAEMRGRAAEISDPGALGWEVVWEAVKTEPPADDPSTITPGAWTRPGAGSGEMTVHRL